MSRQTRATDNERRVVMRPIRQPLKEAGHRFQDIGIAAVAAATMKRSTPRPEPTKETPPFLKRESWED